MEQKLSDTLVKAIDRSNPMMQNLQLASRFNKLIDEGSGSDNNGIYKLICKKSEFRFVADKDQLSSGEITEYEGGIIYPLHLMNYGIKYMYHLAELPETLDGYSISSLMIINHYRGSTVIDVKFKLEKDGVYKQEIEAGLYKIPIHTKLYENDNNYSFKIGELHIEVIDE